MIGLHLEIAFVFIWKSIRKALCIYMFQCCLAKQTEKDSGLALEAKLAHMSAYPVSLT